MTLRTIRGGRGGGAFRSTMGMGFPPFTYGVKWLIIANTVIFILMLILRGAAPGAYNWVFLHTSLIPYAVVHGWIWQLITYSFLHAGIFHILFNMLTLWMFGAQLETEWGHKQFFEFFFYCAIGAALTTVAVAYIASIPALQFLGASALIPTVGASGGIYGVMIAFAMLYGEQEFLLFPLPISIKAKYLVAILVLVSLASALGGGRGESVAYFAHLGGAFFGWIYIRFLPRRGLLFGTSEGAYGLRNRYQKWKRRRMARKFEVYMKKHDRNMYFDQYGNYRPPEEGKGNGDTRPPWVN